MAVTDTSTSTDLISTTETENTPEPHITATTMNDSTHMICQRCLYKEISDSNVRIWDLIIFIPNVLFLIFLVLKSRKAVKKLRRTNSPIFLAFYGLVCLVAMISVLRCVVSMTVNATTEAGDVADKVLWLVLRFFLLATELSVVIFGLAFGHLDSHTSIRRVLLLTFFIALAYSATQGVLEFLYHDETFHVTNEKDESFDIFGHGGMLFWFASSIFFFVIYAVIVILPFTPFQNRFAMPTKRSFYFYCVLLAILNLIQSVGSGLLYFGLDPGLCLVNVTTYLYFTCFAPLVYFIFLRDFFKTAQPQNILFSYKQQNDEDDDQLHLPSQPYFTTKTAHFGDEDEQDPALSQSFDSTHFVGNGPNPLYDADMPFTGETSELSLNSNYFAVSMEQGSNHEPKEMRNPVV